MLFRVNLKRLHSWSLFRFNNGRREGDLNPRSSCDDTRFPSVRTRPLCDPSWLSILRAIYYSIMVNLSRGLLILYFS